MKIKFTGLFLSYLLFFPGAATAQQAVLGVVKSQENANQWQGIQQRLQTVGAAYCVIDLAEVKSVTDFGDRPVLFLPNIETLTPVQVIALEEWMSRGGRVITSGPVGNQSQPGVRQLLRSLLGAYWGFDINTPSNLQPLKTNTQEWVRQNELGGTVRGGALIPVSLISTPAAFWQAKDSPPGVVVTEQSTVLGWRWGVDSDASVNFDSAWLRAVLNRYLKSDLTASNGATTAKNCNGTTLATNTTPAVIPKEQVSLVTKKPAPISPKPQQQVSLVTKKPVPISPKPPINNITAVRSTPRLQSDEPLDRLTPGGIQVLPNSKAPINNLQAIALEKELANLIGRFESAQLTANAVAALKQDRSRASTRINPETALAEAREIAKTLPQLIRQQKYAAARQQWLKAKQLLWNHYPTDRNLAQPEVRAIWLDRGSIVRAGSEQGLAKIFDRLAAAGINTVFFETVNAGYPIYPSQVAIEQNPLIKGWDPLASGVKLAHEREMELHAWVWTFAVGNSRHNALLNLPNKYPGPVISTHPDWASYDNRNSLFPPGQGKPFLDPANAAARQYLLKLFEEIVSRYQVDGLQLDYIRYPFQDPSADRTYGYGTASRQQFQQLTGVDPTKISPRNRQLWQQWTEFRTQQVNSFVSQVSQQLRQKRPHVVLSVAVFPLPEHERIHKLQQHWEVWANRGDVDLVVPMTYALDTYSFQRLAQPWVTTNKLGSALILPSIRLLNLPIVGAIDQIQLSRDLPVTGYALFAVENLSNELQVLFQQTQGSSTQEPIPYRQPFHSAATRYIALEQEWDFLLANNKLWLQGRSRSDFSNQVELLKTALNELASAPSTKNLAAAKAALTSFQSKFRTWMHPHALENPYQVQVWSNRLITIQRLLHYGERAAKSSNNHQP